MYVAPSCCNVLLLRARREQCSFDAQTAECCGALRRTVPRFNPATNASTMQSPAQPLPATRNRGEAQSQPSNAARHSGWYRQSPSRYHRTSHIVAHCRLARAARPAVCCALACCSAHQYVAPGRAGRRVLGLQLGGQTKDRCTQALAAGKASSGVHKQQATTDSSRRIARSRQTRRSAD
jgi:hypothetical protein